MVDFDYRRRRQHVFGIQLVKTVSTEQVIEYTTDKWVDVLDDHTVDLIHDCGVEPHVRENAVQQILKKDADRFITIGMFHYCKPMGDDLRDIIRDIEKNQIKPTVDFVPFRERVTHKLQHGCILGHHEIPK
uniref:Uncharacterized protein n=1 Tax=Globisporangium ultimum (strain ATCC 200006 / CBS 805.95 / DAOM BR144) TaxID=431595 RepID=K3WWE4_GLOUD